MSVETNTWQSLQTQIVAHFSISNESRTKFSFIIRDIFLRDGYLENLQSEERNAFLWFLNIEETRNRKFADENEMEMLYMRENQGNFAKPDEMDLEFLFRTAIAAIVDFVYLQSRLYEISSESRIERIFYHLKTIHKNLKKGWRIDDSMSALCHYEEFLVNSMYSEFIEVRRGHEFLQSRLAKMLPMDTSMRLLRESCINIHPDRVYDISTKCLSMEEIHQKVRLFKLKSYCKQ
jgi:hypothetical protein